MGRILVSYCVFIVVVGVWWRELKWHWELKVPCVCKFIYLVVIHAPGDKSARTMGHLQVHGLHFMNLPGPHEDNGSWSLCRVSDLCQAQSWPYLADWGGQVWLIEVNCSPLWSSVVGHWWVGPVKKYLKMQSKKQWKTSHFWIFLKLFDWIKWYKVVDILRKQGKDHVKKNNCVFECAAINKDKLGIFKC